MEPATWTTGSDASAVLETLESALTAEGYTVTVDESGWAGRAEVGSKVGRALAGGFVRRMVLDFNLSQGTDPGTNRLVVAPASSGWSGGALGASKAKKEMTAVAAAVHQALAEKGLLAG